MFHYLGRAVQVFFGAKLLTGKGITLLSIVASHTYN